MLRKLILSIGIVSLFSGQAFAVQDSVNNPFGGSGNSQPSIADSAKKQNESETLAVKKQTTTKTTTTKKTASNESCGSFPRTCGQMTSCAQAKAALKCGHTKLDRDHDGIPCESICGG